MNLEILKNANHIATKIAEQEYLISQLKLFTENNQQDQALITTSFNHTLRYNLKEQDLKDIVAWLITKHEIILGDLKENFDML